MSVPDLQARVWKLPGGTWARSLTRVRACVWPRVGLVVLASFIWPGAFVQAQEEPDVQQMNLRLERVERVLDRSLLDLLQHIDDLQGEVRELRGEVEALTNQLQTMERRNRELYRDTNSRLNTLERDGAGLDGAGEGAVDDAGVQPGSSEPEEVLEGAGDEAAGEGAGEGDESQTPDKDQSSGLAPGETPGATEPGAIEVVAGSARRSATRVEQNLYTRAYELLSEGQSELAVTAFDEFLGRFPDGPYADNALYWQGEARYALREFPDAQSNFQRVIELFPGSTKVPDARLKIGFTQYEQGEFAAARATLQGVADDYPGRSAAVLAIKRLQLMDREGQ